MARALHASGALTPARQPLAHCVVEENADHRLVTTSAFHLGARDPSKKQSLGRLSPAPRRIFCPIIVAKKAYLRPICRGVHVIFLGWYSPPRPMIEFNLMVAAVLLTRTGFARVVWMFGLRRGRDEISGSGTGQVTPPVGDGLQEGWAVGLGWRSRHWLNSCRNFNRINESYVAASVQDFYVLGSAERIIFAAGRLRKIGVMAGSQSQTTISPLRW
jgi:hypothetical protein